MSEQQTETFNREELSAKLLADLHTIAAELEIDGYRMLRKEELIDKIVERTGATVESEEADPLEEGESTGVPAPIKADEFWESELEPVDIEEEPSEASGEVAESASGMLDIRPDGFGLLRVKGFAESRQDIYISASQVKRLGLRPGDEVTGPPRPPRRNEKHFALRRIDTVNGLSEEELKERERFEKIPAEVPTAPLKVSFARGEGKALKGVDLKKGARILLTGATGGERSRALQELGRGLAASKEVEVFALLIDVPPEVESAWQPIEIGGIAAASYDIPRRVQRQTAELLLERCKRFVEGGKDVVLLLDCVSDLGRGYGSDLNGLHRTKQFFGAGRATAESKGSLTLVATLNEDSELVSDKALVADLKAISTAVIQLVST